MKQIYGLLIFFWLAVQQIMKQNMDILSIASLLGALCLFILKERYFDKAYASGLYLLIALALAQYNSDFIVLSGIPLMDFAYLGSIPITLIASIIPLYYCIETESYNTIFYLLSASILGYFAGTKVKSEKEHVATLDAERRLRYNLENVQRELISSKREIERMTEVRERNRIAHEIHDNIGHGIAGVIFQLEAARRVIKKDIEKTEDILKLCSEKLSDTLELTRNTVHNIRTDRSLGIEVIEKIIKDFKFCPVDFEHSGNFNTVSSSIMEILKSNIMEYLTNASKYSRATYIKIRIDIGKRNIRLYYKDNGIGCSDIKEGLGVSGMKDRIKNIGGTISIDSSDGFLIVCNLPTCRTGEDEIF